MPDLLRDLHRALDNPSRPVRRIDAQSGRTRLSVEFAILDAAAAASRSGDLVPGDKVPDQPEIATVGPFTKRIHRTDPEFAALVSNTNTAIIFKDEEGTGADRIASPNPGMT